MKPAPDLASVARGLAARLVILATLVLTPSLATHATAQTLPRALWVWEADNITDTAKRTALIDFCTTKGIGTVFITTGRAFIDPADPAYAGRHPVTNAQLGNFNIAAHAAGLKVWALDGDPSHCLDSNHAKVLGRLDKARVFNHNQAANARLDGFQWDIEPHCLAAWPTASNTTRKNYLAGMLTVAQSVNIASRNPQAGRRNLNIGFVIPFWYDNSEYVQTFGGAYKETTSHLFDILKAYDNNHVAIMAYRDTAGASFPLAYGELEYARTSAPNVKIWYGQETGPFAPVHITFHEEGNTGLESAIALLGSTYLTPYRPPSADVVAGVAIHAHAYYKLW
jgi:hypothetical protein